MSYEIAVIGGLVGAAFTLLFLSYILDREIYGAIQVLLRFMSLIMLTVSMTVSSAFMRIQADLNPPGTKYTAIANTLDILYVVMTYLLVFMVFYTILILIWNVFNKTFLAMLGKNDPHE